jgi:hypothetical protein
LEEQFFNIAARRKQCNIIFTSPFENTRRNVGKSSFHFIHYFAVCIRNLVSPSERRAFHFSAHKRALAAASRRRRPRILPVRCKFNRDWAAIKCNLTINEWCPLRGGCGRHRVRGRAEGGAAALPRQVRSARRVGAGGGRWRDPSVRRSRAGFPRRN